MSVPASTPLAPLFRGEIKRLKHFKSSTVFTNFEGLTIKLTILIFFLFSVNTPLAINYFQDFIFNTLIFTIDCYLNSLIGGHLAYIRCSSAISSGCIIQSKFLNRRKNFYPQRCSISLYKVDHVSATMNFFARFRIS